MEVSIMKIFGMDLGNKQTKLYSEKTKTTKVLPSHFIYSSDLGNTKTAIFAQKLDLKTYKTSFDDEEYSWGRDMHKLHNDNKFLGTISFENRYETDEFKLLANFALAELASDFGDEATNGILKVTVVTGVPSDDFNEEQVPSIMKVLKGDHNVTIDDTSYIIRVEDVHVLPQSVGTVYNEILDETGYVLPEKESLLEEEIVVNDIGGGTFLIDVLKNMNLVSSYQFDSGAYSLHRSIIDLAKQDSSKFDRLTEYEVDKILKAHNADSGYIYKPNKNESYDITSFVTRASKRYTRELLNKISTSIKQSSSIDTNLYTGGGANLIDQDSVTKNYERAIFVEDSESANVRGFYKFGLALALDEAENEAAATSEE